VGEPFTRYDATATVGITIGAVLVVVYAPLLETTHMDSHQTAHLWVASSLPAVGVLATAAVAGVPLALHWALILARRPSATAAAAAFGVGAGFFGGTSVTFAKLVWLMFAETVRAGGENGFLQPIGFLWALLAFLGELALVFCLFVGVARHEAAVVVPVDMSNSNPSSAGAPQADHMEQQEQALQPCWGCGAPVWLLRDMPHKWCARCSESQYAVCARFCSDACTRENWQRHKARAAHE